MILQAEKPVLSANGSAQVNPVVSQLLVLAEDSAPVSKTVADALENLVWPAAGTMSSRPSVRRLSLEYAESAHEVQSALAADPAVRLIIIYQQPAATVSVDLRNGADNVQPAAWIAQAEQFLDIYRRYRRQVMLVDGDAALNNPSGLEQQMLDRMGAVLHSDDFGSAQEPVVSVELVIADYVIRRDQEASRVLTELKASSLPIPERRQLDMGELLTQWQKGAVTGEEEKTKAASVPEVESTDALKKENKLLLLQLNQVQEELEHYFFANRELEQQKVRLHEEIKWKSADIANMHASMSWKLTAPLRRILDLVSGRQK